MKKKVLQIASALALGLGMTARPAYAVGTDLDLADLLGVAGASVTVGDKIFSNWKLQADNTAPSVDWSQVFIYPLDDDPLNPGLRFDTLQWAANSATQAYTDFAITFDVATADGSARIKDASVELINFQYAPESGSAGSLESYLAGWDLDTDNELFNIGLSYPPNGTRFVDAAFDPVSSMRVYWLVHSAMEDGYADIQTLDIRISQVPEPATLALFGLGLAGIGAIRRKKLAA